MEDYLRAPMHPDYEPIGRMLENCLGVKENIVLHVNYWDFYDWMADQGYDMAAWFKNVDETCPALLHKSADGRATPFPGHTYPTASVTGMPSAVKPFMTATRI